MAKNPVNDPVFKKTLANLLSSKPKTQSEMKIGKKASPKKNKPTSREGAKRAIKKENPS